VYVGMFENLFRCEKVLTRVPSSKSLIGRFVLAGNSVQVRSLGWFQNIEDARRRCNELKHELQPRLNVYGTRHERAKQITTAQELILSGCSFQKQNVAPPVVDAGTYV
jgi:hypothetical protein